MYQKRLAAGILRWQLLGLVDSSSDVHVAANVNLRLPLTMLMEMVGRAP